MRARRRRRNGLRRAVDGDGARHRVLRRRRPLHGPHGRDVGTQESQFGSVLYPAAEPEPRVAVNPTNQNNLVGVFHEDRWSDGGARA
jgi:hypothetical protein